MFEKRDSNFKEDAGVRQLDIIVLLTITRTGCFYKDFKQTTEKYRGRVPG